MFEKNQLDNLLEELNRNFLDEPDYERLLRDAHLAIALADAGRALTPEIDTRVAALLERHASNSS